MSLLNTLRFAYECPLAWEKLTGGDRTRFCGQCEKHVTDLSAMSRAEAEDVLAQATAPMCVRVGHDASGNTVHAAIPQLPSITPALRSVPRAAMVAVALGGAACAPSEDSAGEDSGIADSAIVPNLVRGWRDAHARRKHEEEARKQAEIARQQALQDAHLKDTVPNDVDDAKQPDDGKDPGGLHLFDRDPFKVDPDIHMTMGVMVMVREPVVAPDVPETPTSVK